MGAGTVNSKRGFRRTVQSAARDMKAAELHGQGWTYERIASELSFASRGKAHEAVQRAFADIPVEGAQAAKKADLERLDRLVEQAWAVMLREHVAYSNGQVVRRRVGVELDDDGLERLDDKGRPIPVYADVMDDGPILAAIDRIERLIARRARIFGYEAPKQVEVRTIGEIDARLIELADQVAGMGAGDPAPVHQPS